MTDGIRTSVSGEGAWSWVGVRIDAPADLTETAGYGALSEQGRRERAAAADTAWLNAQWDPIADTRIEVRYRSDPATSLIGCAVLGRVFDTDRATCVERAKVLRERLARLPPHVYGAPIADDGELAGWLTPFEVHPDGIAEIRKRINVGVPARRDAGVAYYLSVEPLHASGNAWESLFETMISHRHPLVVTVGVQPHADTSTAEQLPRLAAEYRRLAEPGWHARVMGRKGEAVPSDPFAVEATRLFQQAAQRYRSRGYRIRITVASPAALAVGLVEYIASMVSPPGDPGRRRTCPRWPCALHRGGDSCGVAQFLHIGHSRVGRALCRCPARGGAEGDSELAELVDSGEAGAAVRFPAAVLGKLPGFRPRRRGPLIAASGGPRLAVGRSVDGRWGESGSPWPTSPGTPSSSARPGRARPTAP